MKNAYAPAGFQLQEMIDEHRPCHGRMKLSERIESSPYSRFLHGIMYLFDSTHEHQLKHEVTMLAAGEVGTADTSLPAGFQRTVIMEALADLRVLELVQTLIDPNAQSTTMIPYEQRDTSGVHNDGIVYEGNPIHRAKVGQNTEMAYITPMKLAFAFSNEVVHFSKSSSIGWDAYNRNVESNARLIRDLLARRLLNEIQRSADAHGAANITGEDYGTQLTGSVSTIKTVNYPIVRSFQARDLKGTAIGAEENPITVVLNGTTLAAYDGTGTQAAGTYYRVTSYNLGYIQFVNEAGVPQTPSNSGTTTVGYSYATNILKVDTDLAGAKLGERMNDILTAIGSRKAVMSADRFINPDFLLMNPVVHDMVTNADVRRQLTCPVRRQLF
ncbi:MAG: hypothetical protein H6966_00625 [Chromatiaceae bacterium]|nr:hypothetical protein [Chromatiaceae bacterium]